MNHPTNINIILGSQIALAMAMATRSPVRARFASQAETKRLMIAKMAKRCESIKKRSRQLLSEMKAHDAALTADFDKMKTAPANDKTELIVVVVGKMVEQQATLQSRTETMLAEMQQLIQNDKDPKS